MTVDRRTVLVRSAAMLASVVPFAIPAPVRASRRARLALIIDDIGYSAAAMRRFTQLGVPLSFAILPRLPRTEELAHEAHEAGHTVMLHQPMEPASSHTDPGPGALYVEDDASAIADVVSRNIDNVPFATGVNNHMGSRFTADHRGMISALGSVKDQGLFFVDSRTSAHTTAYRAARSLGIPAADRDVFLDNERDEVAIAARLEKLARIALIHGSAVGIGHPGALTARAIERFAESVARRRIGIEFCAVAAVLAGS